jgi:hypothetical protein
MMEEARLPTPPERVKHIKRATRREVVLPAGPSSVPTRSTDSLADEAARVLAVVASGRISVDISAVCGTTMLDAFCCV